MKAERIQQSLLSTLILVGIISILPIVNADTINPGLYSPDSKPYGLTFAQWSEKWWLWSVSIPEPANPLKDDTGKNSGIGQNDPNVWYIDWCGFGYHRRSCTIPSGKAILFQPAGNECSYAENPSLKTESELRRCAIAGDQVSSIHVSVNEKDVTKFTTLHSTDTVV